MTDKNVWATASTAQDYLKGTRAAIPLAQEEIRLLLKIINHTQNDANAILDIGCGDGILGMAVLKEFPMAKLVLTDFSETMLTAAKNKVESVMKSANVELIQADMVSADWKEKFSKFAPFDVIISGLAIHHLTHARKKQIYAEIYDFLSPDGIFLNLERVESRTKLGDRLNADNYIDSLYEFHRKNNPAVSRDEIAQKYFYRPLKQSNILAPVELQTQWLRELGFKNVDIFFKVFEIAIFGGTKRSLDA